MISDHGLLYIEPTQPASAEAVRDHLTRMMTAAFRRAKAKDLWCGFHECICGAVSTNCNYRLPNGEMTNSLCIHYVAHHRSEVPPSQLAKIEAFYFGADEPNEDELQGPEWVLAWIQESVESSLGAIRLDTWTRWGLDVGSLSQHLRGGCLPGMRGYAPARSDAQDLLTLLSSIEVERLSFVLEALEREHRDVRKWGERALRVPGWDRRLWVSPLVALSQVSVGVELRSVAKKLLLLGSSAAAAIPKLVESVKRDGVDRQYQYDLGVALSDIGNMLGVALVRPLPPQPGPRGVCSFCSDSGDCYCKRRGGGISQQCYWCDGAGKCHVCKGIGSSQHQHQGT
jgi:hypothetical protein